MEEVAKNLATAFVSKGIEVTTDSLFGSKKATENTDL